MDAFEESINEPTEDDKEARIREVTFIRAVMDTRDGRRFMYDLMSRCGMFEGGYNPDKNQVYFNEGLRFAALYYKGRIDEICPAQFILMLTESREDIENDRKRNE